MSAFTCPHCQSKVAVADELSDTTVDCPFCGGKMLLPRTLSSPHLANPAFDFREVEKKSYRTYRHKSRASGVRIVLWAVFLALTLGCKLLRTLTKSLDHTSDTALDVIADVAAVFFWFLVCYAIDRIVSASDE